MPANNTVIVEVWRHAPESVGTTSGWLDIGSQALSPTGGQGTQTRQTRPDQVVMLPPARVRTRAPISSASLFNWVATMEVGWNKTIGKPASEAWKASSGAGEMMASIS